MITCRIQLSLVCLWFIRKGGAGGREGDLAATAGIKEAAAKCKELINTSALRGREVEELLGFKC